MRLETLYPVTRPSDDLRADQRARCSLFTLQQPFLKEVLKDTLQPMEKLNPKEKARMDKVMNILAI